MLQEMFLALLRYFNISRRVLRILLGFAGLLVQDICTFYFYSAILNHNTRSKCKYRWHSIENNLVLT